MSKRVGIRIWNGCRVVYVVDVFEDGSGYSSPGAVGGAGNSTEVDIELDPWAGLIVDRRAGHPVPVSITEDLSDEQD